MRALYRFELNNIFLFYIRMFYQIERFIKNNKQIDIVAY